MEKSPLLYRRIAFKKDWWWSEYRDTLGEDRVPFAPFMLRAGSRNGIWSRPRKHSAEAEYFLLRDIDFYRESISTLDAGELPSRSLDGGEESFTPGFSQLTGIL